MKYTVLRNIGWRRLPDAWIGDRFMYHVPKDWTLAHGYSYSMAIGDACKVTIKRRRVYESVNPEIPCKHRHTQWVGGSVYNYGIGPAKYPVPALPTTGAAMHVIEVCCDYWRGDLSNTGLIVALDTAMYY